MGKKTKHILYVPPHDDGYRRTLIGFTAERQETKRGKKGKSRSDGPLIIMDGNEDAQGVWLEGQAEDEDGSGFETPEPENLTWG